MLVSAAPVRAACTATFTADESGTFPKTFAFDRAKKVLVVDLAGLPKDATIFRAELVLETPGRFERAPTAPTTVYPEGVPDKRLRFAGPLATGLDALDAVRAAVAAGRPLRLAVEGTLAGVERITEKTIARARLVGECGPLTCWNDTYHQDATDREPPLRYRVTDLGEGEAVADEHDLLTLRQIPLQTGRNRVRIVPAK